MNENNEDYILSTLDMLENSLNELSLSPLDKGNRSQTKGESFKSTVSKPSKHDNFLDELEILESKLKKTKSTTQSNISSNTPKLPIYTDFSAPLILPSRSVKLNQFTPSTFNIEDLISACDKNQNIDTDDNCDMTTNKEEVISEKNMFSSFEELVLDEQLSLAKSFCQTLQLTEAQKMCLSLVLIFYKHGRSIEMIEKLIEFEVSLQNSAGTLFRNNSITTHMMTSFTKLLGKPFIKSVIGPVIIDAFDKIDQGKESYEIDPEKLSKDEDLSNNIASLKKLIHAFFDQILNSRSIIPKPFLEICGFLQKYTVQKFPESRYAVIGGFFFLRFICPAIVTPDGHQIIDSTVTEKQRRCLILVSKVLQTIANEREFGDKEAYMTCMNPLIVEYQSALQYFFNQLAKPVSPFSPDNVLPITITQSEYTKSMKTVYEQTKIMKDKLLDNKFIQENKGAYETIKQIENLPLLKEVSSENRRNAISRNIK